MKLVQYSSWYYEFVKDISLFDAIARLNNNNPVRFYLDALTKYLPLNLNSYCLVKNKRLEVSECSCMYKPFFNGEKYQVSAYLFRVGSVFHIAYEVSSEKFADSVLEQIKNSREIKAHFSIWHVKQGSITLEKVLSDSNMEFCHVYAVVLNTLLCLVNFMKNEELFCTIYDNDYYREKPWTRKDLADYHGYQGNGSVDDFLDNL